MEPRSDSPEFERAYRRLYPSILTKSRRLLGRSAAAEEVAQEVWARFWKSGPELASEPRTVMAWLYRTCTRLAIDALRERRRLDVAAAPLEETPCAVDPVASAEAKAALAALAGSIPNEELESAVLCRVDGLSQGEAALVLGVSERTVRRLLTRFDERSAAARKEFLR